MSTKFSSGRTRRVYEFIRTHRHQYEVREMYRVLEVTHSGYYAWLKGPQSRRAIENARLLKLIRASFNASHGIYGSPRVFLDLREAGETCCKHRVARLMRVNKIRPVRGYNRKPKFGAKLSELAPNVLQRQFDVGKPNKAWATDITYIRTWEGWLYLAVVMDFFSRKIVGWAVGPNIRKELVLDAVLTAVRRRRPRKTIIHSDQGSQYGCDGWQRFCRTNRLVPSMSRRGNCWDNVVAESFFSSLKKEHIKKKIYKNRAIARGEIAEYIEAFYNPRRRHTHLGGASPEVFESACGIKALRRPRNLGKSTSQFLKDQANSPHTFDTLDYSTNQPNDLVFSLGHLAYHIQNAAASEASRSQITSNRPPVDSPTAAVPPTAHPALVEPLAHCMLTDEARADIQGWNDMISERKNS